MKRGEQGLVLVEVVATICLYLSVAIVLVFLFNFRLQGVFNALGNGMPVTTKFFLDVMKLVYKYPFGSALGAGSGLLTAYLILRKRVQIVSAKRVILVSGLALLITGVGLVFTIYLPLNSSIVK